MNQKKDRGWASHEYPKRIEYSQKVKDEMQAIEIEKLMLYHVETCVFWVAAQRSFIFELNEKFKMHTTPELNEKFCLMWEAIKNEPTTIDGTFRSKR